MDNCLVCGNEKHEGHHACKMCGMRFTSGVMHDSMIFCSESCVNYYKVISKKSPEMAERDVVI